MTLSRNNLWEKEGSEDTCTKFTENHFMGPYQLYEQHSLLCLRSLRTFFWACNDSKQCSLGWP